MDTSTTSTTTSTSTSATTIFPAKKAPHRLEKSFPKAPKDIYLGSFALLFSEVVRYSLNRVSSIGDLEEKLVDMGRRVGFRLVELTVFREKVPKRRVKLEDVLNFLQTTLWKTMFGKQADLLEFLQTTDGDAYWLSDSDILVNRYISVNKDYANLNCAAYVAGIVSAVTEGMGFPAHVSAHSIEGKGTTIQLQFNSTHNKK
eukprot:m.63767 g.63767  ORF g.63767 m.63767 type:complete len:201 (-) comp8087_c2_seq1:78-680(-)